jgi:putative oxidoreductase
MRNLLYPGPHAGPVDCGLLLLRLVVGAAFLFHGWPKIQAPFAWMPPDANMPGILQFLAALSEFGGGIALILGLLTRLAALGLAVTMAVAAGMVHIPAGDPFVGKSGQPSWELAAVYFACSVLFLLAGPGRWSVDACLVGRPPRSVNPAE